MTRQNATQDPAATSGDENPTPDTAPETETPKPTLNLALLEKDTEAEFTAAEKHVPAEVKAFVDKAHGIWKEHPKKWREISLDTEAAVKEVTKLARHYAKQTGRVFRVKTQGVATKLVYKVADQSAPPETEGGSES